MKAVLDACVLFPTVLREILADTAAAGLFLSMAPVLACGPGMPAAASALLPQSGGLSDAALAEGLARLVKALEAFLARPTD